MATWEVALFAYHKERHGNTVTVEAEPTVGAILVALAAAGINVAACRLAIGNEFGSVTEHVAEGSDIALIPPVSGG